MKEITNVVFFWNKNLTFRINLSHSSALRSRELPLVPTGW